MDEFKLAEQFAGLELDPVGGILEAGLRAVKVVVLEGAVLDHIAPDLNHVVNPYPDAM